MLNLRVQDQTFTTKEQAELYSLVVQGKVYHKSVDFAKSIALCKNPSANQMSWVNKLIVDVNNYHGKIVSTAANKSECVDVSKILEMFAHAKQHLKRPKITLLLKAGETNSKVRFQFDKTGTYLLMVPLGTYGNLYGRISLPHGEIFLRSAGIRVQEDLMKLVKEFAENPKKIAILHGQLTGNCCFCQLPLSDPKSLKLGYGPICAGHYKLPYVKINDYTAIGDWMNILEQPI